MARESSKCSTRRLISLSQPHPNLLDPKITLCHQAQAHKFPTITYRLRCLENAQNWRQSNAVAAMFVTCFSVFTFQLCTGTRCSYSSLPARGTLTIDEHEKSHGACCMLVIVSALSHSVKWLKLRLQFASPENCYTYFLKSWQKKSKRKEAILSRDNTDLSSAAYFCYQC